jgi:phosphatidylglycerophosphate synthase
MNLPQKISDLKSYQKPHDSIFTTLITRHISKFFSFIFIRYWKNVTPNKVSALSLFTAIIACGLFLLPNYWYRLIGVVLLQIAFAFDCSDGEIARYKNMGSKFGAWFDSVSDRFKEILMFAALTYAWFARHPSNYVWLIGAATIVLWLLISYVREAKKSSWPIERKAEIYITKNIYIGTVDVTIFLVCAAILCKIELYVLALFLAVSLPLLFKQILSAWKLK